MYKKCSKCNETQIIENFHNDRSRLDGKTSACKVCRTKHVLQYHRDNQTWKSESHIKSNKKRMLNPEAKRKASHASTKWFYANHQKTIPYNRALATFKRIERRYPEAIESTLADVLPIYERAYAMEQETGKEYQIDHTIPLQGGGKHVATNLSILSKEDHRAKTTAEYKLIEKLLTEHYSNT